uniref:Catechol O-methyltransferase n=1 Tax=Alexandrium monilatum TaxID=311494 RepID=A0A7S4QCW7_9DINO
MLAEWRRGALRGEWVQAMMARSDTLRLPEPIFVLWQGGLRQEHEARVHSGFRAYIDKKYHKIVLVADFLAASGAEDAEAVCAACEAFAAGGARQWLKVAGAAKAELVDARLQSRPAMGHGVVAEFGSFVGYSCVRMAWRAKGSARVLSLESDAVHVLVARHVTARSRRSAEVEITPGMAHDVVGRLPEDWGGDSVAFAFMDHRGTRFHAELAHLEGLRALAPAARFLADNTLKPGAPELLWHFKYCPARHVATSWSLPEFISETCEDWMSASDYLP